MRASPKYRGASGLTAGATPVMSWKRSKNWTMVKPNPMSETAVLTHDMSVRSRLIRVLSQEK